MLVLLVLATPPLAMPATSTAASPTAASPTAASPTAASPIAASPTAASPSGLSFNSIRFNGAGQAEADVSTPEEVARLEEEAIAQAVDRVAGAVVRIDTVGGLERVGEVLLGTGATSGLIVSADGYIVSSAFGLAQQPASIVVVLASGQRAAARIVATDHTRMLVLLKIDPPRDLALPAAVPRDQMRAGQWAIAVGRTFDGTDVNLSVGIVSALDRIWGKAIQTDAKISPNNYGGPLVDIRGRVLGVLVPMSPDDDGQTAGVEWYDSGIGFAVPLEYIQRVLPRLAAGEDLRPGLLGVSFKSADLYGTPPVIAARRSGSPAHQAGLEPNDQIVEIEGRPVERLAQVRHELLRRHAGDKVRLVVLRSGERVERTAELAASLPPHQTAMLGILPLRDAADGVGVRLVLPGSPAEKAGLRPGDRIAQAGGEPVGSGEELRLRLAALEVGQEVELSIQRDGQPQKRTIALAPLSTDVPGALPPAHAPLAGDGGQQALPAEARPPVGIVPVKVPELANEAVCYVPRSYDARVPHALVVWPHASPQTQPEAVIQRVAEHCERTGVLFLLARPAQRGAWQRQEVEFLRKAIGEVASRYHVDPGRIVAHGEQAGGAMAYLLALGSRDLVRGLAVVDAPLPLLVEVPPVDPIQRLLVYAVAAEFSAGGGRVAAGIDALRGQNYPLVVRRLGAAPRNPDDELGELFRWIDSLDRL